MTRELIHFHVGQTPLPETLAKLMEFRHELTSQALIWLSLHYGERTETLRNRYGDFYRDKEAWIEFNYKEQLEFVILKEDEEVLGYLAFHRTNVEIPGFEVIHVTSKRTRKIHIDELYISKEHRRQGVATDLLRWVYDFAQLEGYGELSVSCDASNVAASWLYVKLGYRDQQTEYLFSTNNLHHNDYKSELCEAATARSALPIITDYVKKAIPEIPVLYNDPRLINKMVEHVVSADHYAYIYRSSVLEAVVLIYSNGSFTVSELYAYKLNTKATPTALRVSFTELLSWINRRFRGNSLVFYVQDQGSSLQSKLEHAGCSLIYRNLNRHV